MLIPRFCRLGAIVTILACDSSPQSEFHFRDAGTLATQSSADTGDVTLEYVRTWGTAVGPAAFNSIGPVGVNDDGLLAAFDTRSCELVIFDLNADSMVKRFGRCGEGPGDIPRVTHLAFVGDTLLLLNEGAKQLHYVLTSGEELRRVSVGHLSEFGGIQSFAPLSADTVLVSRSFSAGSTLGGVTDADLQLLAKATIQPPRVFTTAIGFPPVMDEHRGNFHVGYVACASSGDSPRFIGLLNRWAFETVIVRASDLEPVSRTVTPLSWGAPEADRLSANALMPTIGAPGAVCGDDWVLFSQLRLEGEGRTIEATGGHVEIRGYDGALRARINFERSDTLLFGTPVAAYRDRVFYRANRLAAYPQITEFRVAPAAETVGSKP